MLVTPVYAADVPQSSQRDNRIQYVNYHPADVVVVKSMVGIASRIIFEKGETIVSVDAGSAEGWDISDKGRIMTIKPVSVQLSQDVTIRPNPLEWGTNIAVETNKRLYDFDVHLVDRNTELDQVSYRIEFQYPVEAEQIARLAAARQIEQSRINGAEKPMLPTPKNTDYTMMLGDKSENIAPTMAFDDGLFTFLRFPNNREFPTVFVVTADGMEGKINTHVHEHRRDILVVQRVAKKLILRLGSSVVGINNGSFDIDGRPPVNGTSTPALKRTLKGAQQ